MRKFAEVLLTLFSIPFMLVGLILWPIGYATSIMIAFLVSGWNYTPPWIKDTK